MYIKRVFSCLKIVVNMYDKNGRKTKQNKRKNKIVKLQKKGW